MADYKLSFTAAEIDEKLGMVAQPDWSQNDETAPDYIKNRPFYENKSIVELLKLENATFVVLDESMQISMYQGEAPFEIEVGQTYIVNWDGTEYTCIASVFNGTQAFGDFSMMGGSGNGEPFAFAYDSSNNAIGIFDWNMGTSHNISVFGITTDIKYIDPKYIKDMYYDTRDIVSTGDRNATGTVKDSYAYRYVKVADDIDFDIEQYTHFSLKSNNYMFNDEKIFFNKEHGVTSFTDDYGDAFGFYAATQEEADIFYNETIYPEEDNYKYIDITKEIVEGQTYNITCDSQTYECIAKVYDSWSMLYIGNGSIVSSGLDDTGEPFAIIVDGDGAEVCFAQKEPHTISITTMENDESVTIFPETSIIMGINTFTSGLYLYVYDVYRGQDFDVTYSFSYDIGELKTIEPKYIKDMYCDTRNLLMEGSFNGTTTTWGYLKVADTIDFDINKVSCISRRSNNDSHVLENVPITINRNNGVAKFEYDDYCWGFYAATQEEADTYYESSENNPFSTGLYLWVDADSDIEADISYSLCSGEFVTIEPKYLPIMTKSTIFEGLINGFEQYSDIYEYDGQLDFTLNIGHTYDVIFDGEMYSNLVCFPDVDGDPTIGASDEDYSKYPFGIENYDGYWIYIYTNLEGTNHTISIIEHNSIIDEKYLPNISSGVQSNLSQTDSLAEDYVKGVIRNEHLPEGYPYKEIVDDVVYDGVDVSFSYSSRSKIYYHMELDCKLIVGETYVVTWDGVEYANLVAYTDEYGWTTLGSSYDDIRDSSITKDIPFCIFLSGNSEYPECDTILEGSKHNIKIIHKKHVTHTLAKEFIPSGTSSWNDLTDKPFSYEDLGVDAMTITWDGNIDGRETTSMGNNMYFCKVSDAILPLESFNGGIMQSMVDGNIVTTNLSVAQGTVQDGSTQGLPIIAVGNGLNSLFVYAVQEDISMSGNNLTAGVHFLYLTDDTGAVVAYVSELQTVDAIRLTQIEEKFIPYSVTNVTNKLANTEAEEWIFELEDGTMVTKKVVVNK